MLLSKRENAGFTTQVATLTTQVVALLERVQTLEARQVQNSHNSSKPPSSDDFTRSPKNCSLRKTSGKKTAPKGYPQAGHAGKALYHDLITFLTTYLAPASIVSPTCLDSPTARSKNVVKSLICLGWRCKLPSIALIAVLVQTVLRLRWATNSPSKLLIGCSTSQLTGP